VGNVSTNVYAKFRCASLSIKKALGIFGSQRTDNNSKKNNYSGFLGPAFRVQKKQDCIKFDTALVSIGLAQSYRIKFYLVTYLLYLC